MIKRFNANQARLKRHRRVRSRLEGSEARPRLSVYRSGLHIYAQIIDDTTGQTLAAASSLDQALRDFTPPEKAVETRGVMAGAAPAEMTAEVAPTRGKGAKTAKAPAKGAQPQKGAPGRSGKPAAQVKTQLPSAEKGVKKTPVEALAGIADNRKVAVAREGGKLVAQRARENGIKRFVFYPCCYPYPWPVAALSQSSREIGLHF